MKNNTVKNLILPFNDDENIWEIYHENSKVTRYDKFPPENVILSKMSKFHESLPYIGHDTIILPEEFSRLNVSIDDAILSRMTTRSMEPTPINLNNLAIIFRYAYGVTRPKTDENSIRSFRTVPSGGALYPLELFFHNRTVDGLKIGLYHYNPIENNLKHLRKKDQSIEISQFLTPNQSNLAFDTSIMIFITGIFERETFKYGSRGYRYVFLEAGHVAQNINLVTNALGLGSINICGYFDREVDEFLNIDGITHSTIYMIGIGKEKKE